ncbi:MAG: oligosaccharide flippase family protein [Pseudomonadota bacterium]|nr:oligosaccharide flippase family protein [Pseudomonadota bacterium]
MRPTEAIFGPALVLMSGRALGFVAGFVVPLVLARAFGQAEFGTYKQLFLVYGTLFAVAQVGMAESLYYFLPSETERKGNYVVNVLLVLGLAGLAALLVLTWQQDRIALLLNNPSLAPYLPLTGLFLLLMLASLVLEIVMTAQKQHVGASVAYALTDIGRALLMVVPVLIFGDLFWLLLGAVIFAAGRFFVTLGYLQRAFGEALKPNRALLRKQLGYALPFGLAGLIEVVQLNLHMYVVSWYFDAATFAIYAVGCLQLPVMDFLMTSTSNVMMVQMRERLGAGDFAAVRAIWLDAVRKLALILFPIVGVLVVLAHELIVVMFTEAYAASVPVFVVFTLGMSLIVLLSDSVLRVYAQNRYLIVQNLLRLLLIAALISPCLDNFGLVGAVLVTLLANASAKVFALARVKTLLDVSLAQLLPWRSLAVILVLTVFAGLVTEVLRLALPLPPIALLVVCGGTFMLTYYVALLCCGPLHDDEKQELLRLPQLPVARLRRALKA